MAFVYILKCADGAYYVGSTRASLEARVNDHNGGRYGGYTESRRPVTLVWAEEFERITGAVTMERRIKGWSRAKKEALIVGNYRAISILAKRRSSFETAAARPPQDEGQR
ncbi:MAG TPA: GIY-YIG nuclease family protein [Stellaceae bacterium]|jgi:putative endonuclease|nr:GIY-YIG nuclease family protein [Stellaceae bacterium]